MKKSIIFLMLILTQITYSQNDYKNLWRNVEDLEIKGLPKSASKEVELIYKKAKQERNSQQIIKTLFYKSKFVLILEEDAQLKVINQFKEEISESSFPEKNMLENVLANLYWEYYQNNRWQFINRTKTQQKVDKSDFRTWDLQTLFEETHQYFSSSMNNEKQLQKIEAKKYNEIIKVFSEKKRPSLYDFLANNALVFYKTSETSLAKPKYQFKIDNPDFIAETQRFLKLDINTKDKFSLQFNALKIYQKLLKYHLENDSLEDFATTDLERLDFVKEHKTFQNVDELYLKTLINTEKKYKNNPVSGLYAYKIAEIYNNQANSYNKKENKKYKNRNNEALKICEKVISYFPKSTGAKRCLALKKVIKNATLKIQAEEFTPNNKNARMLVTYKNINKLYFSAYEIDKKTYEKINYRSNTKKRIKLINNLKPIKTWERKLRNEQDYLEHSTEVIVPKFANGNYLIVASLNPKLSEKTIFGTAKAQYTNLAFIKAGEQKYQVVDRITGAPIKNAKVHLKNDHTSRYNLKINKRFTTNKDGFIYTKTSSYHDNVVAIVSTSNDKGIFGDFYIQKPKDSRIHKDDEVIKPFVFTDRSIYRPSQTVYFKGIIIAKENNKSRPFTEAKVNIALYTPNGEKVKELEVNPNEFGSVSGEFILPNNGLTGEYQIRVNLIEGRKINNYQFRYTNHTISVEEYKRPKFEVDFKSIKEIYSVNDEISVKGFAKAFSGATVTDAKVVYRVYRSARYPRWWYWGRPSATSSSQEIKSGELTTDEKGDFDIKFKALVDESINKKDLPIFSYKVTAEVTDINGETHEATTSVNVGYHTLIAGISIPKEVNATEKQVVKIETNNLNGEAIPATGTFKVYKLQAPKTVLRKRPWAIPDYQDISETEFRKLFPFDAYLEEEQEERKWKKGKLVFEENFDTSKAKEIKLPKLKKWELGKYIAILASKDKLGQEVKDEVRFTVFNIKADKVADNTMFFMKSDANGYTADDKVKLQLGSASKDFNLILQVEKDYKITDTKIIHIDNTIKTITLPFTKKDADLGGFAVHYYYVNHNDFKRGTQIFNASNKLESLQIETNTFRDKLQPGSEQTWSFTIKNDKGDKATAEVLASMYDASLDKFKSHQWFFNPISFRKYYSRNSIDAFSSFGNESFRIFNREYQGKYRVYKKYNQWKKYGFDFNGGMWVQQRYVGKLKNQRKIQDKIAATEQVRKEFDHIVSGVVSDKNGELIGVKVHIEGTSYNTLTDIYGAYKIKVKKGDVLVFSFVGMQTVKQKETEVLNVEMEASGNNIEEVVNVGYAKESSMLMEGKVAGVRMAKSAPVSNDAVKIRGASSLANGKPIYVVDGIVVEDFDESNTVDIASMNVLKDAEATAIYGSRGANGVIVITTKSGQGKLDKELSKVHARENLQETAFFYPKLATDKKGNVSFSFTIPEALTRWKLNLLAHNKELAYAVKSLESVTQKELMVVPNVPRFLRHNDKITLSAKISNLSDKNLQGTAQLVLTNAVTGKTLNLLDNSTKNKTFSVDKDGNTNVSWDLVIPDNLDAVQYKIVAKADGFSDGEQNALPVLSNRMLVTETLPLWVNSNQSKMVTLDKLKNNNSSTLKHHKLTLEITSNPAWYAVQALPYLMEYPYECSEQTFSRYYANTLSGHIVNQNPRIKAVFEQWKTSGALISNLEKNQELKSLIIEETPWLRDAQSETEQKKRIALLFDLNKMKNMQEKALSKLQDMQFSDGGFSWFKGARRPNPYISQHIATGFGHLKQLGVKTTESKRMISKLISFLDEYIEERYRKLIQRSKKEKDPKKYLAAKHIFNFELQYLYMRSFYSNKKLPKKTLEAKEFYIQQSEKYWQEFSLYGKGLVALVHHRNGNKILANTILKSLDENSITSEELGMYWKDNQSSWRWYQAPIETQSLLIEAFSEIKNDTKTIDNLKKWLLKNKQVNRWKTTKATSDAVYALLLQGTDWISVTDLVEVKLGDLEVNPTKIPEIKVEAGTGYFKTSWSGSEINPKMADVTITSKGKVSSWGGLYWQYFEDLDKITTAETPLKLKKKLFKKVNSDTGKKLVEITEKSDLKVGDLLTVRIELRSDRDMEFIFMKDMRASGVEPISVLSTYKWQDGLGYYESTKDASTNFFFERLPKGVFVFEYDVRVNNAGNFSNGITSIESMYAPEFKSHSEGVRIEIKK